MSDLTFLTTVSDTLTTRTILQVLSRVVGIATVLLPRCASAVEARSFAEPRIFTDLLLCIVTECFNERLRITGEQIELVHGLFGDMKHIVMTVLSTLLHLLRNQSFKVMLQKLALTPRTSFKKKVECE